ncbi:REP-associated tyrosine transposase [Methylomonas albis]|uniref:Transposase n=1 Tax=Methylomonas albis TaxID=1854563 RepID=A0ABR9D5Y1_9GAMM|nr:transposase [Methylomonas albis]MBD9358527.1 transposase [Methylomonas albis]
MSDYRRVFVPGGNYFFTVVTYRRRPVFELPENIELLRTAFKRVMAEKPFKIDAMVILPDHCHCIWQLPVSDQDFSGRWREIKKYVSKRIGAVGKRPGERDIWQRRFWEHQIRDEDDWRRHMDYIHYNPVKHGLAPSPIDWPYSSFKKAVKAGWYDVDWQERSTGFDC